MPSLLLHNLFSRSSFYHDFSYLLGTEIASVSLNDTSGQLVTFMSYNLSS